MANALMRERGGDDPMRKQRAEWAPGYRVKVSADTAHSEFERIRRKHGALDASRLVEEERDSDAPLHDEFEWNDREAARIHREVRARELIRGLRIFIVRGGEDQDTSRRAYVFVESEESVTGSPGFYARVEDALRDPASREQVLARAKADLASWRERYRELTELATLFEAVDSELRKGPTRQRTRGQRTTAAAITR